MAQDHYGNEVSTASQAAIDHYNTGIRLFLAAEFGAVEAFGAAVELEDGFALGHVGLARALMMAGRMPEAKAATSVSVICRCCWAPTKIPRFPA